MAAVYAALVSLLNTMDQFQIHPHLSDSFDPYQNEILRASVDFFLAFVENYHDADSVEVESLMGRIAAAAHDAEDVIEAEAADRMRGGFVGRSLKLLLSLQSTIEDMKSIKEMLIVVKGQIGLFINSTPSSSSPDPLATGKITTIMVGFNGYLEQLLDELISSNSGRRILPIVGMGGIGKTTLARNVYENSVTLHHFNVRCWVTVSQNYNATGILSQALSCLGGGSVSTSDDQVGEELHKTLFGRRYLIVLDDLWSVDAWEMTRFYFPENSNGSRIIVTTRQQQVVNYFGSSALALGFLDDANSWVLFCDKAFAQQGCPLELEQSGKNIVQKCRGLPLAISVIGGLLGKSPRTQEYWEIIAHDTSVILEDSGDEINKVLSILYLSYRNLPVFLKPCFIYLGLFEEDHPIQEDQLIQLWVAEGYIKPERNRSLEEVGESYVKELVDRNLLKLTNKKFKNYSVHDLVRELCIRIALQEKFYCIQGDIDGMRYPQYLTTYERPSQTETEAAPFKFKSRLLRIFVGDIHCLGRSSQLINFRFFMNPFESWMIPIHSFLQRYLCVGVCKH